MSTDEKREKMLSLVADWKASGLTQKAFSTLHGMKVATLGYWVARSKNWTAITLSPSLAVQQGVPSRSRLSTGVRLRVEPNLALIAQLIRL